MKMKKKKKSWKFSISCSCSGVRGHAPASGYFCRSLVNKSGVAGIGGAALTSTCRALPISPTCASFIARCWLDSTRGFDVEKGIFGDKEPRVK